MREERQTGAPGEAHGVWEEREHSRDVSYSASGRWTKCRMSEIRARKMVKRQPEADEMRDGRG